MDTRLKLDLIKQAQQNLVQNPQDPMHDVTHHYRVVQLAKQIIQAEQLQDKVDADLVEVICWWHDVKVADVEYPEQERVVAITAAHLANLMPQELKEITRDSIAQHEFGSTPMYLEGKILQDADKLEILSPERVDLTIDNIKAGILDRDKMLKTLEDIKSSWLPRMPDLYHFEFSQEYHKQKLPFFLEYIEQSRQKILAL